MSVIRRKNSTSTGQSGQSIYQTMLIIACVTLGLSIVFPIYELIELYRGGVPAHPPVKSLGGPPSMLSPEPAAVPAPKREPAAKPAVAREAPKPVAEPVPAEAGAK